LSAPSPGASWLDMDEESYRLLPCGAEGARGNVERRRRKGRRWILGAGGR
jgi:hypothetical protein